MPNKIKARRMWAELPQIFTAIPQVFYQTRPPTSKPMPVAVIPVDDPEALVRSINDAFWCAYNNHQTGEAAMRYALEQHGILTKPTTQERTQ